MKNQKMKKGYGYTTHPMLIYVALSVSYLILMLLATLYGDYVNGQQQLRVLVNITMGIGFICYLKINQFPVNFELKIYDKKCLYIVYTLIFIMVSGNYFPIDTALSENINQNIWLLVESLTAATAFEAVFRASGPFLCKHIGPREEAVMIICYAALFLYEFLYSPNKGIFSIIIAIGVGTLLTGIYLRYRKLGANIVTHFLLFYLLNVTDINSSIATPILGKFSSAVLIIAALGMFVYGCRILKMYNAYGIFKDDEIIKKEKEKQSQFRQAYFESKEKYEDKISQKTTPIISARREKYIEKNRAKEEKRIQKAAAKGKKKGSQNDR